MGSSAPPAEPGALLRVLVMATGTAIATAATATPAIVQTHHRFHAGLGAASGEAPKTRSARSRTTRSTSSR